MNSSPLAGPVPDPAISLEAAPAATCPASPAARRLAKRLGVAGFAFFAIKGILWLIIPTWLVGKGCAS